VTGKRPPADRPAPGKRAAAGQRVRGLRAPGKGAPGKRAPGKGAPNQGAADHRGRSLARRLALQALYQLQLNPSPWADTQRQFAADPEADRADLDYFRQLIAAIAPRREALDSRLAILCEIAPPALDPIEHAVLWLGLHELESCPELPYRVALAEAVQLAKQFGATDGHKFVNAVLDRAAQELRPQEYGHSAK
jgi:N utilization substance protein B